MGTPLLQQLREPSAFLRLKIARPIGLGREGMGHSSPCSGQGHIRTPGHGEQRAASRELQRSSECSWAHLAVGKHPEHHKAAGRFGITLQERRWPQRLC